MNYYATRRREVVDNLERIQLVCNVLRRTKIRHDIMFAGQIVRNGVEIQIKRDSVWTAINIDRCV